MIYYTPEDLVRIELLRYCSPEGLHPIEEKWRDLARKLLDHVEGLQSLVVSHHDCSFCKYSKLANDCPVCKKISWLPYRFPQKFIPKQ